MQQLMKFTRHQLNMFLLDCYGEDGTEWDTKQDLVADIVAFGYAQECIEYLS